MNKKRYQKVYLLIIAFGHDAFCLLTQKRRTIRPPFIENTGYLW